LPEKRREISTNLESESRVVDLIEPEARKADTRERKSVRPARALEERRQLTKDP